jgi:murein DD-endopeptidase MepM/ murein hydrolase activator NlpD
LAPADGVVVYARNDVPDQPKPGKADRDLFVGLPEPMWAVGGNCVVLDHGNDEFSYLGHLQKSSVTVEKGAKVKQGQVLGLLGSSGNAQGPHLHYHLMAGGVMYRSDGLPSRFLNVADGVPRQGRFAEAK